LLDQIQAGRQSGRSEQQIRQEALKAGWDQASVDQAWAVAKALKGGDSAPASAALPVMPEGYRIGPGDVLQIVVWKEPEASVPRATVRADGRISLPLTKEVEVSGLTPSELEKVLNAKLAGYINSADVTVIAAEIHSMKVYLAGAVKKEGPVTLLTPMTVFQALNEAGGLTDYAKRKKIYVLRQENGKPVRHPFNYSEVLKGQRMEQNILLKAGDTVVVPN
jgi:polysaccharide export outer membrane protein